MWSLCKCIMWHVSKCLSVYSFCPSQLLYHYFPSLNSLLTCPHDLIYLIFFFFTFTLPNTWFTCFYRFSASAGKLSPISAARLGVSFQSTPQDRLSLLFFTVYQLPSSTFSTPVCHNPPGDCLQSEAKICIWRNTISIFLDLVQNLARYQKFINGRLMDLQ